MFSKQSLFLAFHRFHKIHGHRGTVRPTAGRFVRMGALEISDAMEGVSEEGRVDSGARSHTSFAPSQFKNTCRSSSLALHVLQPKGRIPMFSRLALTGIALRTTFHKKSFSFGAVLTFQMLLVQLNPTSGGARSSMFKPAPYPVFVVYTPDLSRSEASVSGAGAQLVIRRRITHSY